MGTMKSFKQFILERAKAVINPFNPLSIRDLRKDENRVLTFIQKIKDGEEFTMKGGGTATIPKSQLDEVEAFLKADKGIPAAASKISISTSAGKKTIPNDFLKTGDFGGKGAGAGTNAETLAMNYFNKKLNEILAKENKSSIRLKINGRIVDCAAMVKTTGSYEGKDPKSDMTIVDTEGNPVAFISHKAGRTAKDYQQYGGLSYKIYENNSEIKNFMNAVKKLRPTGLKSTENFYRPIKTTSAAGKKLVMEAIYGPEYSKGKPSIHNVDEFHLGNMDLIKSGKVYTINSVHKGTNGDVPKGDFAAILLIRFQGASRSPARAAGVIVPNARVGIFPLAKKSSKAELI